ncbi:hypothetical protein [Deinococcus petrolearius]|uniref:Uncharacterized protein n=1 Tax=Deinococcus petrolearius TaxID=1751295 RepID=A0ABW1DN70_9DEIO
MYAARQPRTERELFEAFPVRPSLGRSILRAALSRLADAGYLREQAEPGHAGTGRWTRTPEGEAALKRSELSGQFTVREAQVLLLLSLTPQTTDELCERFEQRHRYPVSRSVVCNALHVLKQQDFSHKDGQCHALTLDGEEALDDARARITLGGTATPGLETKGA